MGATMRVVLESFHRPLILCLASVIVFFSVLIIGFPVPPAQAATNGTVQRPDTPMPPCMRRVTVTSKPCGAMIYVDGIQVGRTPMSFPMPTGRYTLFLFAPGHQPYAQRILVPDAPLEIDANLVPDK
jgi:PEGA domain